MKITSISIFEVDLKLEKPFQLSGGRELDSLTSAVASVTADNGITGWGESCPWGSDYLPAFPEAVIAGLKVLAPQLLGEDPFRTLDAEGAYGLWVLAVPTKIALGSSEIQRNIIAQRGLGIPRR